MDQRPKLKPASKFIYRRLIERMWLPRIGHVQLRRLQRETIRDILLAELAKKRAPNTVQLYLAVLTKMLGWAVREDRALARNPAEALGELLGLRGSGSPRRRSRSTGTS